MTVLEAVVFRAGNRAFTRADVLRWAERHDASFAARVKRRRALAALASEDEPPDSVVEEAAANFRYDRGLEDAGDMQLWLEKRQLSVDAWWEALRRSALEATPATATGDTIPEAEDDAATSESWLADLCATDLLDSAALDLARRVAVAMEQDRVERTAAAADGASAEPQAIVPWDTLGVDPEQLTACDARLDALTAAWKSWRPGVVTDAALKSVVDHHRLEWLVLDLMQSWWPSADSAREAMLCVSDDGESLEAVSRDAHQPVEPSVLLLEDAPPALHDRLLAAAAGDVVGPVEAGRQWVVASVRGKRPPSLAESLVRAAAERAVERAATTAMVERHVAWPDARP
jgi:hypothetical protein